MCIVRSRACDSAMNAAGISSGVRGLGGSAAQPDATATTRITAAALRIDPTYAAGGALFSRLIRSAPSGATMAAVAANQATPSSAPPSVSVGQ